MANYHQSMDQEGETRTASAIDISERETEREHARAQERDRENAFCTGTFREYSTHCHSGPAYPWSSRRLGDSKQPPRRDATYVVAPAARYESLAFAMSMDEQIDQIATRSGSYTQQGRVQFSRLTGEPFDTIAYLNKSYQSLDTLSVIVNAIKLDLHFIFLGTRFKIRDFVYIQATLKSRRSGPNMYLHICASRITR